MKSPLQQLEEAVDRRFGHTAGCGHWSAADGNKCSCDHSETVAAIITAAKAYALAIVGEDDLQEKGGPLFKNARNELRSQLRREIEGK